VTGDDVPSAVVTCTVTLPAACGGTVATSCKGLRILTFVAGMPPKLTEGGVAWVPDERFDPLMMTAVPPAGGAVSGTIDLTVGVELCCDVPGLRAEARSLRHELSNNGTAATSRAAMQARIFRLSALDFMVTFLLTGLKPAGRRGAVDVKGRHSYSLYWASFSLPSALRVSRYAPLSVLLC